MLTAAELRIIQHRVKHALGVYHVVSADKGTRHFSITCIPDGITWLLQVKDEKGRIYVDCAIDGRTVEEQLCALVDQLKKKLEEKPS